MKKHRSIVIAGNMNVGKTSLFSKLCGSKTASVNIPGNTVTLTSGHIKGTELTAFDTPGILSIFSTNEDERASRDILLPRPDGNAPAGVVLVADAKSLRRSIAIALQYAEYGLPMLLDINMIDEAASRGIDIDCERLAKTLGISVCTTVATEGIGVARLRTGLSDLRTPARLVKYPFKIEQFLEIAAKLLNAAGLSSRALCILLLAGDPGAEAFIERTFGSAMLDQLKHLAEDYSRSENQPISILLTYLYNKKAEEIATAVQTLEPPAKSDLLTSFGDWCTQLSTGIPIAVVVLCAMYLFVGTFGATFLVDAINTNLFNAFIIPHTARAVALIPNAFIYDMIIDPDFGILPTGVFLAVGLVVPVLFCFYIAFGMLEDSGYLPRLSILLDKVFKRLGLNGKGVIPLAMGFSCVTMAILTTRVLSTEKEKNIASFLVFLTLPCAPMVAVMLIILHKLPLSATVTVFGMIMLQVIIAGMLANKIVPGTTSSLIMEIPPMRLPKPRRVMQMSYTKTVHFLKEALPVFIIASFIIFLFERAGGLTLLEHKAGPLLGAIMGLPEQSIQVFIKTMIRRESGAAELEHLAHVYTNLQLVVNLLVMTFIAPCVNATVVLFKERGIRAGSAILASVTAYAIVVGSVFNYVCRFLGITFT